MSFSRQAIPKNSTLQRPPSCNEHPFPNSFQEDETVEIRLLVVIGNHTEGKLFFSDGRKYVYPACLHRGTRLLGMAASFFEAAGGAAETAGAASHRVRLMASCEERLPFELHGNVARAGAFRVNENGPGVCIEDFASLAGSG